MMVFYVDLPTESGPWTTINSLNSKEEAVKFIKEKFGGDENGCICLISEMEDEVGEEE